MPYKNLPIIALTANAVNGVHEMFLECGMNDFIAKPIELSTLDRALKKWLPQQYLQMPSADEFRAREKKAADVKKNENTYFNPDNGLVYTGGDFDTYLDILDSFVRKADSKREYINELFGKKDWKNYIIEVHSLKSSACAIGAADLSELSKKLELAGKAGDYKTILDQNAELLEQYKRISITAEDYYKLNAPQKETEKIEISSVSMPELSKEKLEEYVSSIAAAADNFDGDEIVRIAAEASAYVYNGFVLKKSFDEIIALTNDFEYESVKSELEKISEMIKA